MSKHDGREVVELTGILSNETKTRTVTEWGLVSGPASYRLRFEGDGLEALAVQWSGRPIRVIGVWQHNRQEFYVKGMFPAGESDESSTVSHAL
jgi:hypothetical protein